METQNDTKTIIEITREDLKQLLIDYGHHAHVRVPVDDEHGDWVFSTVLVDGMVYNPFEHKQYGMSNNKTNAENAMKFITEGADIYSSVFNLNSYYAVID